METAGLRIDHLAHPTFDSGETHRFYTEVMGFPLVEAVQGRSDAWGGRAFLLTCFSIGNGQVIDFFEVDGLERPPHDGLPKDIRHLALAVESRADLAAWKRRLESHGIAFDAEDHGAHDSIYFCDPNGLMLEITYWIRPRDEKRTDRALGVVRRWTAARSQQPVA